MSMRFINNYSTSGAVQTALDYGELNTPYVASIEGEGIDFNTKVSSLKSKPLTFKILSNGYLQWGINNGSTAVTIQYSKNGGEWTNLGNSKRMSVNKGDIFEFKGNNNNTGNNSASYSCFGGACTAPFIAYGNMMSLLNATDYATMTQFPSNADAFPKFFLGCTALTDASALVLPITDLVHNAYLSLFEGCSNLKYGPILPATTISNYGYDKMFKNCSKLKSVICLATNNKKTPANPHVTPNWLQGANPYGIFYKNSATEWNRDASNIPEGWEVVDF